MEFSVMDLTEGWLTDWSKGGGRFKEWIRDLECDSINHGWWHSLSKEPGRFFGKAMHILSWLPYFWDDYDWDNVYLYKIMREKVRRMRLYQEESQLVSDWALIAGQLQTVEWALDRLIEDDYLREEMDAHRKKYGDLLSRSEKTLMPDGSVRYRTEHKPGEREDFLRICDAQEAAAVADLKLVAKHFVENSRGWWD